VRSARRPVSIVIPVPNISTRSLRLVLALGLLACGLILPSRLAAVTLGELLGDRRLNAKRFASHFGDFAYEFNSAIQSADTFLTREKGDCDDYSILADYVLGKQGLTTRLIHVRLTGRVAHAVCYVAESGAYLDYNNRNVFFTLTRSGPDLREIATKVADSLNASWTTASEFTYSYESRRKQMIATVAQTGGGEPAAGGASPFNVN
jgi:hypothetical protein